MNLEVLSGKKITVAGASGFIGQNLVQRLHSLGTQVKAVSREPFSGDSLAGVDYITADLMTQDGARTAAQGSEVFVMAAAASSGAAVMANSPLAHLVPNVVMNALTLEASMQAGVEQYCFLSSNSVYPPGDIAMSEPDATGEFFQTYEVVAGMKFFSEKMAEFFSTKAHYPMRVLVARPGNLYGPHDKFADGKSKVIPALIKRAVNMENPFTVWGDGQDIKDFLYIDDFVEALVRALALDSKFEVLNIASGKSVRLQEVIEAILELSGNKNVEVKYDESKPSMIPVRHIDISLAQEKLGWTPQVDLRAGLAKTIEWYKSSSQRED
jgi:GDP-L-fucose synthase